MLPLPQLTAQAVVLPLESRHLGSLVQVLVQPVPSPLKRPFGPVQPLGSLVGSLPQSQASPVSLMPLPQTATVHLLGVPVQDAPGSSWQVAEQPSPLSVLPSSHCSLPVIFPSPQSGMQALPGTRHWKPDSTVLQSPEQPSLELVLPSSQTSGEVTTPSPHFAVRMQACPTLGQLQPASSWQILLQPSPPTVL